MDSVLITGAAGFIGYHLSSRLIENGYRVIALDNLNDYYDVRLKEARLDRLTSDRGEFEFHKMDLADTPQVLRLFSETRPDVVVNLAAQAGVRYSIEDPYAYVNSNVVGFLNVLEGCRRTQVQHLVFASSSSVYGANTRMPFSVHHSVDHPVSFYAATKKANELMAHSYSYLYGLPTTGLRFFTVYGPWGRPDMALFLFTEAILKGEPIKVYNNGMMRRDFTYIDDVVECIARVMTRIPSSDPHWSRCEPDPATSSAPYRLYNVGSNNPVELLCMIEILEHSLGRKSTKEFLPMQPGDVPATYADVGELVRELDFRPCTPIEIGVQRFVDWYRSFYGV